MQITENEFYDSYELVKNKIDKDAAWGGYMFETNGEEFDFVKAHLPCVWTIVEDDGILSYVSGLHRINRLGYLITTLPPTEDTIVLVYEEKED